MSNENNPPIESGDIWRFHGEDEKVAVVGLDSDLNGVYLIWDNGMCLHVSLSKFYNLFERTDEHVDIPGILEVLRGNKNG